MTHRHGRLRPADCTDAPDRTPPPINPWQMLIDALPADAHAERSLALSRLNERIESSGLGGGVYMTPGNPKGRRTAAARLLIDAAAKLIAGGDAGDKLVAVHLVQRAVELVLREAP